MDRVLVACFTLSATGLIVLASCAIALEPRPVAISRLDRYEGQRVCVDATLAYLRATVGDSRRFLLVQGNDSLPGRARFAWAAVTGDKVHTCGSLGRETGSLLLNVERPEDARVLRSWDEDAVALSVLAERPWQHLDRRVATFGVPTIDGRSTFLIDAATGARLRLSTDDAFPSQTARVEGVLSYDADESRFSLHVETVRGVDP